VTTLPRMARRCRGWYRTTGFFVGQSASLAAGCAGTSFKPSLRRRFIARNVCRRCRRRLLLTELTTRRRPRSADSRAVDQSTRPTKLEQEIRASPNEFRAQREHVPSTASGRGWKLPAAMRLRSRARTSARVSHSEPATSGGGGAGDDRAPRVSSGVRKNVPHRTRCGWGSAPARISLAARAVPQLMATDDVDVRPERPNRRSRGWAWRGKPRGVNWRSG